MGKIGIVGYGNLGQGVECALRQSPDLELAAVFTRRDLQIRSAGIPAFPIEDAYLWQDRIDVMILCGGSAGDLPAMTPRFASMFHVVDSFDTHAAIPTHFAAVDKAAGESGHVALISAGWDPGLFSLQRLWGRAFLPVGETYTFWGKGVSQGHSQAIRRIPGVVDARQYTVPKEGVLSRVRTGECPHLTAQEMHERHCFVAVEDDADRGRIAEEIKGMPHYFAGYDTTVEFMDIETLLREHGKLPHGGTVIRSGGTGECQQTMEFRLSLESNPHFTASVLVACARAVLRMGQRGERGCKTVFDLVPADLSLLSREELIWELL